VLSAVGPSGIPIQGLKLSDFAASLDGQPVPTEFSSGDLDSIPVSFVILIDSSGSMTPKISALRQAITLLIQNLNPCDEVALIAFTKTTFDLQSLTTHHELINKNMALIRPYGQTSLYDAIDRALRTLDSAHYSDRAILLVTDGIDDASSTNLEDVLGEVRERRVPIFVVGIGDPNAAALTRLGPFTIDRSNDIDGVDPKVLNQFVANGNGRVWIVPEPANDSENKLSSAVAAAGRMLGRGYVVGVVVPANTPADAIPQFTVKGHPEAFVRAAPEISMSVTTATDSTRSASHTM
jgi:VWFA-related protein